MSSVDVETVSRPWWRRWIDGVAWAFRTDTREKTSLEASLEKQLAEASDRERLLTVQIGRLEAKGELDEQRISGLLIQIVGWEKRFEALTAIECARIAAASGPHPNNERR